MKFYSDIEKNKTLSFAGKWIQLKTVILSEMSQTQESLKVRKTNIACFLSLVDPNLLYIHKTINIYTRCDVDGRLRE